MGLIFRSLSLYRWYAIGAAGALLLGILAGQHLTIAGLRVELAQSIAARATEKAAAAEVARKTEAEYRAKEAINADKLRKAESDYTVLQTDHARALAAQRVVLADNGRLRSDVAAYAAGRGQAAPDTAASASDRAARLGELLAAALQADAEHAAAAESNGDAVRALLAAWPTDEGMP